MNESSPHPPAEPAQTCGEGMPFPCAKAFQDIAAQCARLGEGQQAVSAKLDAVGKAVLGNGTTKDSLSARVERLESSRETRRRSDDRFWKVFSVMVAAVAVIVAIFK